ncbi:DUF2017 family protein [Ruicaihuangia caeni]|uniref:DUF2017 family protein n=1 Tax=Ruicaihuangia caeni TaxID=3042517 RepID=UPI00338F979C
MMLWHWDGHAFAAEFSDIERAILAELAGQLARLVEDRDRRDPAVARLLPDAYRDDEGSASEFRRLTQGELAENKIAAARGLAVRMQDERVRLDETEAWNWLRALTDLRLVLASRLGLDEGGGPQTTSNGSAPARPVEATMGAAEYDAGADGDEERQFLRNAFEWLAYVQESLIAAMDRRG